MNRNLATQWSTKVTPERQPESLPTGPPIGRTIATGATSPDTLYCVLKEQEGHGEACFPENIPAVLQIATSQMFRPGPPPFSSN